jgi:MFS family permease
MLGGSRLWRHPDFLKLWSGQTISVIGGEITALALPTLAIFRFHTSALVVGLLIGAQRIAFPILSLFAGVLVDRVRRRPLMILADVVRGIALASIPLAFALNVLTLAQLFAVGLIMGIGNVLFDIAYLAYLPSLVGQADIVEGNNKLTTSFSIALLAGPGLGGVLVQLIGAAQAIGANAISYVVSVLTLAWIRQPEPRPRELSARPGVFAEIAEGIRLVVHHPLLRSLLAMMTVDSFAFQLALPVFLIFFYRRLHLTPAQAGLIFASLGFGSIVGSVMAARVVAMLGLGRAIALGIAGSALALAGVPLALFLPAVPWLIFVSFVDACAITVMDIQQVSLRQGVTPSHLQGRMNATFRTLFWGVWPLANFLGGLTADWIGPVSVFLIAAGLRIIPITIVVVSPIGRLRSHPVSIDAADPGQARERDQLGLEG